MNAVAAPRPKPSKPRANFPLFPHPNGQWCKKINGKPRHFGSWRSDPTGVEAERRYKEERRDWEDGRNPRIHAQAMSLMELADRWLVERLEDARRGDISAKSYDGSWRAIDRLKAAVPGWDREDPMRWVPDHFKRLRTRLATNVRPYTLAQYIIHIRAMFNWGARVSRILPTLPDWGNAFRNVSVEEKERDRFLFEETHGERRFELDEARTIIRACERAATRSYDGVRGNHAQMIVAARLLHAGTLLAANCGSYSADIAALTFARLDLDAAYARGLRTKNSKLWQATLWPETVAAIRSYLEVRPAPARNDWTDRVFLTSEGYPVKHNSGTIERCNESDALAQSTDRLLRELGLKTPGLSFGAWRHTFISMSEEFGTEAIRNRITGHKVRGARHQYLKLRPEQLRVVTDGVRRMIFPDQAVTS